MDKGFHFFDLACWFANSFPNKIITIANPLSTKEFLKNNDYSDAVVNMKFSDTYIERFYLDIDQEFYPNFKKAINGKFKLPSGPGLGIDFDYKKLSKYEI